MTASLRALLEKRRAQVEAQLARLEADERSILTDRSDGTADDEHDPEGSTLSGEWSRIDALRRERLAEREEIDAALTRADNPPECATCGSIIPAARLAVRPMTRHCVRCAR